MSPKINKKLLAIFIIVPIIASVGMISFIVISNLPEPKSFESKIQSWMTNAQIPSSNINMKSLYVSLVFYE